MTQTQTSTSYQNEPGETKSSLPYRAPEPEMSEFERARETSKTWSMGQD